MCQISRQNWRLDPDGGHKTLPWPPWKGPEVDWTADNPLSLLCPTQCHVTVVHWPTSALLFQCTWCRQNSCEQRPHTHTHTTLTAADAATWHVLYACLCLISNMSRDLQVAPSLAGVITSVGHWASECATWSARAMPDGWLGRDAERQIAAVSWRMV